MAPFLQRGQIVRIITPLPTIKRLPTDAKVTAGMRHVAAATTEIHPGQPNPSLSTQTPLRCEPVGPNRAVSLREFAFRHSIRVSLIILNESRGDQSNNLPVISFALTGSAIFGQKTPITTHDLGCARIVPTKKCVSRSAAQI